ncbi:MAG: hypothetical protein R8G60_15245 [Roseovarius pacificus]|nr:hypothetical protein [Roseovarius pacificus]
MNRNTPDLIKDRETAEMLNIGVSTSGAIPKREKYLHLSRSAI